MIKVALVSATGDLAALVSPSDDGAYIDGQMYGENLAVIVPADTSIDYFSGKYYKDGEFIQKPDQPSANHKWNGSVWHFDAEEFSQNLRSMRNAKLSNSDWTQMPDSPLTEQQRAEWAAYRQSLRDVPQDNANAISLDEVQWPQKPET
jgi:hypothetical protein